MPPVARHWLLCESWWAPSWAGKKVVELDLVVDVDVDVDVAEVLDVDVVVVEALDVVVVEVLDVVVSL